MLVDFVGLLVPLTMSIYLLGMLLRFGRWFMAVRYPQLRQMGLCRPHWTPIVRLPADLNVVLVF